MTSRVMIAPVTPVSAPVSNLSLVITDEQEEAFSRVFQNGAAEATDEQLCH